MSRAPRGSYGKPPIKADTLGKRIRRIRMAWQWSQAQLAAAIHSNQKTLSRWELDRQEPSELALGLLAGLFGLEVDALRTGQGFQLPNPPQQIGKMLVADSTAINLLELPQPTPEGVMLIDRRGTHPCPISVRKAHSIIRQAQQEGLPIYLVIG